ncbi:hypothetical protein [Modicisalibacter radicis]|nr:hypothetical protein [Halomonas sp. EAR18]
MSMTGIGSPNVKAWAREVQRALEQAQRDATARGRSSMWDRE